MNKILYQGQIFIFFGQLYKISDCHFYNFANCYYYLFYHSTVILIAISTIFWIKPINIYSVEGSRWLVSWRPTWNLLRYLGHGAVDTLRHLFCDAGCPKLQRNAVLGMVENFSGWLSPQQGWQRPSYHSRHCQFHSCCRGIEYIQ